MPGCFNFTATRDRCYRFSFSNSGLRSTTTTDLGDGTTMHCWIPKTCKYSNILLPQTPEEMRQLIQLTLVKPIKVMPTCFLTDFINVMYTECRQEKKELIEALYKNRKLSKLPKITQPTLIIWGEQDQIFPPVLAHRLKRHVGENAKLVVIKNAGHALNIEKFREMYKNLKPFLIDSITPSMQWRIGT